MFRKFAMLLLVASTLLTTASTETKSEVKKVTVFLNGAQVTREFKAKLTSGTQTLRITDLSPYLDAKTIQVKGNGEFTILSIRHQMNYIDVKEVQGELKKISDSMNYYQRSYKDVDIELNALSHSEQFLQSNRMVKGNNDNLDVGTLQGIHQYYYAELLSINKKRKVLNYKRSNINAAIKKFTAQLNAINGKLTTNTSEVLLELQAKSATSGNFMLSYLVNNASWYPSYDIMVQNINHWHLRQLEQEM